MKFHSNRFLSRPAAAPFTNHSFFFRKWLGRNLVPFERRIIEPLERIRHRRSGNPAAIRRLQAQPCRPMRVFVDDLGLHGDAIRNILVDYVCWLQQCIEPELSTVIVHRSKKLAREAVKGTPLHRSPQAILCSCKRPHSVRGITFHRALLLDTGFYGRATIRKRPHRYAMTGFETCRPERTQAFRIISAAIAATLPTCHSSLLIIHGDPRQHPRQDYARLRAGALSDPGGSPYTVISPDAPAGPSLLFGLSDTFDPSAPSWHGRYLLTHLIWYGRGMPRPQHRQSGLSAMYGASSPEPLIIIPA